MAVGMMVVCWIMSCEVGVSQIARKWWVGEAAGGWLRLLVVVLHSRLVVVVMEGGAGSINGVKQAAAGCSM